MRGRRVWRRARFMHGTTFIAVRIVLLAVVVLIVPLAGEAQQFKEVLPKVSRVALLGNPANPNYAQVRHARDAARALGVRLQPLEARDPSEIDNAFVVAM